MPRPSSRWATALLLAVSAAAAAQTPCSGLPNADVPTPRTVHVDDEYVDPSRVGVCQPGSFPVRQNNQNKCRIPAHDEVRSVTVNPYDECVRNIRMSVQRYELREFRPGGLLGSSLDTIETSDSLPGQSHAFTIVTLRGPNVAAIEGATWEGGTIQQGPYLDGPRCNPPDCIVINLLTPGAGADGPRRLQLWTPRRYQQATVTIPVRIRNCRDERYVGKVYTDSVVGSADGSSRHIKVPHDKPMSRRVCES